MMHVYNMRFLFSPRDAAQGGQVEGFPNHLHGVPAHLDIRAPSDTSGANCSAKQTPGDV